MFFPIPSLFHNSDILAPKEHQRRFQTLPLNTPFTRSILAFQKQPQMSDYCDIDEVIRSLERLARGSKRRGRPPAWMKATPTKGRRRGRPSAWLKTTPTNPDDTPCAAVALPI